MNHSDQRSRFESYPKSQPQFASHVLVIADGRTWPRLLAKYEGPLWPLLHCKICIKGSLRLLFAFSRCLPSQRGGEEQ